MYGLTHTLMGHAKGFASFFGRETSANWVFFGRRYDARKIKTPGSLGTTSHNAFEEVKIETLPGSSSVLAGISSWFSKKFGVKFNEQTIITSLCLSMAFFSIYMHLCPRSHSRACRQGSSSYGILCRVCGAGEESILVG